ncbi:hypothetical protein FOZ63_005014, partial [Perkinsus olseni]
MPAHLCLAYQKVSAMVARIALQAPRNSSNAALCVAAQPRRLAPCQQTWSLDVKTGAAMVVYRGGVEVYFNFWKLSFYAKITDCEFLGVLEGVRWIVAKEENETWEFFTDSQAVLKILSSRASTARWDKARQPR